MEKNFIRVRSTKDIIISSALTAAGCILIALPTATSVNVFGFFLIFAGILLFCFLKSAYKDTETGLKYCKKERFFAQAQRAELVNKIAVCPNSINLAEEDKGNAVRLDIYYNNQSGKSYLQVFEYIPYKYEPCSGIFEHPVAEISKIR